MANWVVGYPIQTDREIDLMYESESAKMWEEQNAHDRDWDRMLEAVGYLNVAIEHLDKATDSLIGAKEEIEGLPAEYRLGSIEESLEELNCEIEKIRQRFISGEG